MKTRTVVHLIDAGAALNEAIALPVDGVPVSLIADDNEYARGIGRLAQLGATGPAGPAVPDEVFLHLYAYEVLERMREQEALAEHPAQEILLIPLWPVALFEAAGAVARAVNEIQALFTKPGVTYYVQRSEAVVIRQALRVMGALRFDPAAYLKTMDHLAEAFGWKVIEGE